jgi:cysteine desulfurase
VLRAIGLDGEAAQRAVRIGLGRFTTEAEVDRVAAALADAVEKLRAMSGLVEV